MTATLRMAFDVARSLKNPPHHRLIFTERRDIAYWANKLPVHDAEPLEAVEPPSFVKSVEEWEERLLSLDEWPYASPSRQRETTWLPVL